MPISSAINIFINTFTSSSMATFILPSIKAQNKPNSVSPEIVSSYYQNRVLGFPSNGSRALRVVVSLRLDTLKSTEYSNRRRRRPVKVYSEVSSVVGLPFVELLRLIAKSESFLASQIKK